MRVQITETKIYTFAELSEPAKAKAIEWYSQTEGEWWEPEFDDFLSIAAILGFHLKQERVRLMNGSYRDKPAIYYSGFWSQGDGACFNASYCYAKGCKAAIRAYAPKDIALHKIADRLAAIQRPFFYRLTGQSKHNGRYCHEYSMAIDVEDSNNPYRAIGDAESDIIECFRDLARWLYQQLQSEYEYRTSEESAIGGIETNAYEFDVNGKVI